MQAPYRTYHALNVGTIPDNSAECISQRERIHQGEGDETRVQDCVRWDIRVCTQLNNQCRCVCTTHSWYIQM